MKEQLEFICAVYNEEHEVGSLIEHVYPVVDRITFVDDDSFDKTFEIIERYIEWADPDNKINVYRIDHSGLPEYVKDVALSRCGSGNWVLMLDADERFTHETLKAIRPFLNSSQAEETDYVYFRQVEIIDGKPVREFQKAKLFRAENIKFATENIHADDELIGRGIYQPDWTVLHRKTSNKQINREVEYLRTYTKLLDEGKIDEGRYNWLVGLHHFVKPHG
jgi:glycosyltransferase involved in cell wall biosynthesis